MLDFDVGVGNFHLWLFWGGGGGVLRIFGIAISFKSRKLLRFGFSSHSRSMSNFICGDFMLVMLVSLPCICRCVFLLGGNGGTPLRYGHKEIYKNLNLKKNTTS